MKQYKVFQEVFKGHPIIAIWEVDPAGNKVGKYPYVSFGVAKAKVILANIETIKAMVG